MTSLTKNQNGYHTIALLVADLERAIDKPKTLRRVMSDFRDINYYCGKVNLKAAELKAVADALLTELQIDLAYIEAQKAAKAATTAILESEDVKINNIDRDSLSNECLQWLSYSGTPGIVMVMQRYGSKGCYKWVTYGSHAQAFNLLTRRDTITERGYSKIEIPAPIISYYESLIQHKGVPLTFVY